MSTSTLPIDKIHSITVPELITHFSNSIARDRHYDITMRQTIENTVNELMRRFYVCQAVLIAA